jgi:membrane-associated phospholipid phosphatase
MVLSRCHSERSEESQSLCRYRKPGTTETLRFAQGNRPEDGGSIKTRPFSAQPGFSLCVACGARVFWTLQTKGLMLEICKSLLIEAAAIVRKWFLLWILLGLVMVIGAIALHSYDAAISNRCLETCHGNVGRIAGDLTVWGSYRTGSPILCAVILIAGIVCRRKTWQAAAIACLLSVALAGLEADVLKSLLGRARPNSGLQDGFYGPSLEYKYQSFPSGHATTSSATAMALAVALPPVGVPALVGAAGVMWSRVCLGVHYPTDVWVGGWIGALNGLVFGLAARRLCAKAGDKPAT